MNQIIIVIVTFIVMVIGYILWKEYIDNKSKTQQIIRTEHVNPWHHYNYLPWTWWSPLRDYYWNRPTYIRRGRGRRSRRHRRRRH